MISKVLQVLYFIVFGFLACVAVIFGLMCFSYNRFPEGLIIIGAVLAITIVMLVIMRMNRTTDKELVFAQAGHLLVEMEGVCHFNQNRGVPCKLICCKYGFLIESDSVEFQLHDYTNVSDFTANKHDISIVMDNDVYRFVSNQYLKIKAISNLLKVNCK